MKSLKFIFDLVKSEWHNPITLLFVLVAAAMMILAIDLSKVDVQTVLAIAIVSIGIVIIWKYSNRLPKTNKNKVGFIVAIKISKNMDDEQLKSDFADNIKKLLNRSSYRYQFHFLLYPQHFAKKITTHDDAKKYLIESKGHFILFGHLKQRLINGKQHHILDLDGGVRHRPLPAEWQKQFAKEFGELLPKRMLFKVENDIFSFEITSNLIQLISKYIVGNAAYLSGDFDYSLSLFNDIRKELENQSSRFPSILKIKKKLPEKIVDVNLAKIDQAFENWKLTKDPENLQASLPYFEVIEKLNPNNYSYLLRNAIRYFVIDRNISKAKQEIHKCRHEDNPAWRYSNAFLFAFENDLDFASKQYQEAFRKTENSQLPIEVEEFIIWVLQEHPEKTQLYYCLGLINYFGKKDFISAIRDFRMFLDLTPSGLFVKQKKEVREYITEIENQLRVEEHKKD